MPKIPKYWNFSGSNGDMNLNNITKSGMESVYTTDALLGKRLLSHKPIGKHQLLFLNKRHPK